jgi:uncharacterized protein (TIGR02453 family)
MLSKEVIQFLKDVSANNNRDWFAANKSQYEKVKLDFEKFCDNLIKGIADFDKDIKIVPAKDCTFRIYRDTRFSPNKTPYKNNMGCFITPKGKNGDSAGYYFHIEPGNIMIAGGIYMPPADILKKIRSEIYFNADEFLSIINDKAFIKFFDKIEEEGMLKKAPKDFPPEFEHVNLLKYKHYTVMHGITEDLLYKPEFLKYAIGVFKAMLPLNSFLRRAISN